MIATTSSAAEAEKLKQLGADHVLNYKEDANWGKTARGLTHDGGGVDHTIEVGGADSLQQSLEAVKYEGIITIIGFLGGQEVTQDIFECFRRVCTARGGGGGSWALGP